MDELRTNQMKRAFYAGFSLGYGPMANIDDWEKHFEKFLEQFKAPEPATRK